MIAFLRGRVFTVAESWLELDVAGIGFRVWVPERVARQVTPGSELFLYIYHHMRADGQELFGFADEADRAWFERLLRISGIGPKLALQVVSAADRGAFAAAVSQGDASFLAGLPGIGKKTAARLLLELRDWAEAEAGRTGWCAPARAPAGGVPAAAMDDQALLRDVVEALTALGYHEKQAWETARGVLQEHRGLCLEDALRMCLQALDRAQMRR
ncbi:Holliday junction ATP-dependent DNA helicase RuvA [Alicyclobacillus cellulosilyticus]|uniref:Holliday junction branch migration complex subunit RuvA n=1 Tax=Alicyclobacillus cellulosilyticus TaxID=1003997 RepID=A0A917KA88_9BACL|nr:Holliday junction branch migration protein RuvA [Alicyclobacillus cellulosilyticus]GGJ06178.1 Holliday junction ATP-dependent DNA helicase RuvA [Alicyclobacillus cellulosilyticus]